MREPSASFAARGSNQPRRRGVNVKKEFIFPMTAMAAFTIIIIVSAVLFGTSYAMDGNSDAVFCYRMVCLGVLIASLLFGICISLFFLFEKNRRNDYFFMLSSTILSVFTWAICLALLPIIIVLALILQIYSKARLKKIQKKQAEARQKAQAAQNSTKQ